MRAAGFLRPRILVLGLLCLALVCGSVRLAWAVPVCSVADVAAVEAGCPGGSGTCLLRQIFEVGDGCTLDFAARNVIVTAGGSLRAAVTNHVGAFQVLAGSFTVASGGSVEARGDGASGLLANAGMISLVCAGNVVVEGAPNPGRIDVSGNLDAGRISIVAGGTVTLRGRMLGDGLSPKGGAGTIDIDAEGDIAMAPGAEVSSRSGVEAIEGGLVSLSASGAVRLAGLVDITGSDGGSLAIDAKGEVDLGRVEGSATGDAGSGGCIEIAAQRTTRVLGAITLQGGNAIDGGGCGGLLSISVSRGDVAVENDVDVDSGSVDGAAGEVVLEAAGVVSVSANASLSAAGTVGESCGGSLEMTAGTAVQVFGDLEASGGIAGGSIDLRSRAEMEIGGNARAEGRASGATGGCVALEAGRDNAGATSPGILRISGTIDASGGGCGQINGCGSGGEIDLSGCDVTLTSSARVLARGADGGLLGVTARRLLRNDGVLDASRRVMSSVEGVATMIFPVRGLLPSDGGDVSPEPGLRELEPCTMAGQALCLIPCPTCGNGVVEYPESCDGGNRSSCDGCSSFCRVETCVDSLLCTTDLCDPEFGCYYEAIPPPCVEPPTPTPSVTPTRTRTATRTGTATITRTLPPSSTPTESVTPTPSATRTSSPTQAPSATISPSPSMTPTLEPTSSPTRSPTPSLAGDASCNGVVTAADFPALVGKIVVQDSSCGADADRNGALDEADLSALAARIFSMR